jgi:flagellar hook-associated protein 1 FlgK
VHVGGRLLVQNETADRMEFDLGHSDLPRLQGADLTYDQIDGRIGGLLQVRDQDLAQSIRRLDEFAARLVRDVNELHAQGADSHGVSAGDFFTLTFETADGIDQAAGSITVRRELVADSSLVAAGSSAKPGDNTVALELAALRSGLDGPGAMLQALVVDLGARARESEDLALGQGIVVDSFRAQRESVSGVSLDEEAASLMRFQRSYEAAARILSLVDEMAQTLLSI